MLGLKSRHLKLKEKDRKSLQDQCKRSETLSKECRRVLFERLEGEISRDDIQSLQFGLTESDQQRPTSEKILVDDSNLYARFQKAMKIVGRSALKMKAFGLRDNCQYMDGSISNTIKTIVNILEENGYNPPKDRPDFPDLEEDLDSQTLDFLYIGSLVKNKAFSGGCKSYFHPEEDVTDFPSQELLYVVRNIVIFREMLEMIDKLKDDIASVTK